MLKTLGNTESMTRPKESGVGIDGNNKVERNDRCKNDGSEIGGNEVDGGEIGDNKIGKKGQKISKSKKSSKSKKTVRSLDFLTQKARLAFTILRQAFVKAPILHHFDPKRYIRVKMDTSSYAIGGILSQLTLDDLGYWHPLLFFSQKMIPLETRYKLHNSELLRLSRLRNTT